MLLAPVQWPVQLVAWLPDFLRPGAFCAIVLAALWFVFVQRGLPNLWHALCRGVAILVDVIVGLLLLPEYLLTTSRQKQQGPGQAVLVMGNMAERVLDGAGALHQRHLRDSIVWKRFPWIPVAIVLVVITLPWAVMKLASPTSAVRQELSQAYEVWREVEAWADVDPSRRADPGVVWPPRPRVLSTRVHGRTVGVTLRCRVDKGCRGRLILRNGKGVRLRSRLAGVPPTSTATLHIRLSEADAASNFISVRVARADPE